MARRNVAFNAQELEDHLLGLQEGESVLSVHLTYNPLYLHVVVDSPLLKEDEFDGMDDPKTSEARVISPGKFHERTH